MKKLLATVAVVAAIAATASHSEIITTCTNFAGFHKYPFMIRSFGNRKEEDWFATTGSNEELTKLLVRIEDIYDVLWIAESMPDHRFSKLTDSDTRLWSLESGNVVTVITYNDIQGQTETQIFNLNNNTYSSITSNLGDSFSTNISVMTATCQPT